MNSRKAADDFDYLNDVLQSGLPDSAKLFFAELIARPAFRSFFGVNLDRWQSDTASLRSIELLENAGLLAVIRDKERVRYVAHRRYGQPLSSEIVTGFRIDT